ncbi:MAG: hypothetical protein ACREA2_21390 [Blastocatellia bacterium]
MNDKPTTYLTILSKNTMFSFLGLVRAEELVDTDGRTEPFTAVVKMDPREGQPIMKHFETISEAARSYQEAVNTSIERGWSVIYQGAPLRG